MGAAPPEGPPAQTRFLGEQGRRAWPCRQPEGRTDSRKRGCAAPQGVDSDQGESTALGGPPSGPGIRPAPHVGALDRESFPLSLPLSLKTNGKHILL